MAATSGGLPAVPGPSLEPALAADAERLRMAMIKLRRQVHRQDTPGLSIELYSALATVVSRGGLSVGELALAEHLPPSAATRLADRLEEAGLVLRRRTAADRRAVLLEATPEGCRRLDERRRTGNAWLARRLGRLSPEQRATVRRALDVLEGVLLRDLDPTDLPAADWGEPQPVAAHAEEVP